jgi:hypothetical protein
VTPPASTPTPTPTPTPATPSTPRRGGGGGPLDLTTLFLLGVMCLAGERRRRAVRISRCNC